MRAGHAFLAAALSHTLIQRVGANIFYLSGQWSGNDFFQHWNWETKNDPTHGRVNYVSQDEAKSKNLAYGTFFSPSHFRMLPNVPSSLLVIQVDSHRPAMHLFSGRK
jgi:hypothetical protein